MVIATDGRLDASSPPSIAYVLVDLLSGDKVAGAAVIPPSLRSWWTEGDSVETIALVEQAAVWLTVQHEAPRLRSRDVVWYVDNSVILSAMCKGASHTRLIDEACGFSHLVFAHLGTRIWWEYIESHANWSDRMSRELRDPWLLKLGFRCGQLALSSVPWTGDVGTRARRVATFLGTALGETDGSVGVEV